MFQELDPSRIIETSVRLQQRIVERFPGSGLSRIAEELSEVARATQQIESWLAKPLYPVRIAVAITLAVLLAAVGMTLMVVRIDLLGSDFSDFAQGVEASINDLIFVGIAIYFLLGLERRLKRVRALKQLHVLRSMSHIIDLHQLSKDPEQLAEPAVAGAAPELTPLQMARYLDYSSELLAVASKIAALYVQRFDDAETLAAAGDVETLTVGLSQKIWQKINILNRVMAARAR
jgi:hypothetical protein